MSFGRTRYPADAVSDRLEDASAERLVGGVELFVGEQVVEGVERGGEVARDGGVRLVGVRLSEVQEGHRRYVARLGEGVGVGLKSKPVLGGERQVSDRRLEPV